jgi:hypothetical protein
MPIESIRHSSSDITEHIATGVITDDDMFARQKDFLENNLTKSELWDMSGSKLSKVTIEGMRQFMNRAAQLGEPRRGGKTAVVVHSTLQYGLGRIAEVFSEFIQLPFEFRIFKLRDDAIAWLNDVTDIKESSAYHNHLGS